MRRRAAPTLACLLLLSAIACGGEREREAKGEKAKGSTASAQAEPRAASPEVLPATQRMLGKWRMNLAETPDTALTEDFLKLKQQGNAEQLRIHYTVTEREFILETWGPRGPVQKRWFYEVLKENGDALVLERTDEAGQKQQIPARVEGDTLRIGTGNGIVPLERVRE